METTKTPEQIKAINLSRVKSDVKREFCDRKKKEEGLKLSHVYNDYSRRNGFKNWNEFSAKLNH